MRLVPVAAILAIAVLSPSFGAAQPVDAGPEPSAGPAQGPSYNIMGPASCARWPKTGAIASASKAVPLNWALGFLSGRAEQSDMRLFDLLEPEEVDEWLTSYCQSHPEASLPLAASALERDLLSRLPPKAAPPKATAPTPAPARRPPARRAPAR